jgi:hypothetical protein
MSMSAGKDAAFQSACRSDSSDGNKPTTVFPMAWARNSQFVREDMPFNFMMSGKYTSPIEDKKSKNSKTKANIPGVGELLG